MQPLKLTIPGSFYDSLLYKGHLYLWDVSGKQITTIDWDRLVESIRVPEALRLPLACGFRASERLYKSRDELLYRDKDFRRLLTSKFARLAERSPLDVSAWIPGCTLKVQPNPFAFPHSDVIAYYDVVYVSSGVGVQYSSCHHIRKGNPIRTNPQMIWAGRATGIAASYGHMAISAGSEGLIDVGLSRYDYRHEPSTLSTLHSTFAAWTYWSVFSGSFESGAYLAEFTQPGKTRDGSPRLDRQDQTQKDLRIDFMDTVSSDQIFGSRSFAWGRHDKLCQIQDGHAAVVRHVPWKREFNSRFVPLGRIALGESLGDLVSVDSALFGFILEYDQGLKVVQSDGQLVTIPGEPVNWRVFPMSVSYENQLHILYDDRLEIWSFNNDYLVDQESKIAGVKYSPRSRIH